MKLAAIAAALTILCSYGIAPTLAATPSGWDFNLQHRCASTTGTSGDINYYGDGTQCPHGITGERWRLIVESEGAPGASCPGPANRSFPINDPNSPIILEWLSNGSGWTAHMLTDTTTHWPCSINNFTYFGFQDEALLDLTALPDVQNLLAQYTVAYGQYHLDPNAATRLVVGVQVYYGGKAHILEINLTSSNWPPAPGSPPGTIYTSKDFGGSEYTLLDGATWGITAPDNFTGKTISVPWKNLIQQVLANGWWSPLQAERVTQGLYIGTEVKGFGIANLYQTQFEILRDY